MADRFSCSDETMLEERLRREARESRPEFSEQLHARICDAVSQRRSRTASIRSCEDCRRLSSRPGLRFGTRRSPWIAVAATAAFAAGVAAVVWGLTVWDSASDVAGARAELAIASAGTATSPPDWLELGSHLYAFSDLPDRLSGHIDDWTQSAVVAQQWAYLDHDAQLTVRMLANRLPFDVASSLAWPSVD